MSRPFYIHHKNGCKNNEIHFTKQDGSSSSFSSLCMCSLLLGHETKNYIKGQYAFDKHRTWGITLWVSSKRKEHKCTSEGPYGDAYAYTA